VEVECATLTLTRMAGRALVVLGSSRQGRDSTYRISSACRRVVAHAERLAGRTLPEVVVFSGWAPAGGSSEAEQMRALWRRQDAKLVLEETASTTAENAARTLPLLLARGIDDALVVCCPLHMYRARWFFRRLYGAHGIQTSFDAPRILPSPSSLMWELGALTVRGRQLRAAEDELRGRSAGSE
jgi:uncharacterized SAM-binding protein YcdF (DUF218 family)